MKVFLCCLAFTYLNEIQCQPIEKILLNDKMNVYFISGLGADQRVFKNLAIDPKFNVHHIEWIRPNKKESIKSYSSRLMDQIDTSQPYQLVGLSFGGMIATVISEIDDPEQIILISSNSVGIPLSKFYRGLIGFVLLSPFSAPFLKSTNKFTNNLFGANTPEEKALLKTILKDTDSKFLKWALKTISKWDHPVRSPIAYQINGTDDRMIQARLVDSDKLIQGGEHLMVLSKADEISPILNKQLSIKFK